MSENAKSSGYLIDPPAAPRTADTGRIDPALGREAADHGGPELHAAARALLPVPSGEWRGCRVVGFRHPFRQAIE